MVTVPMPVTFSELIGAETFIAKRLFHSFRSFRVVSAGFYKHLVRSDRKNREQYTKSPPSYMLAIHWKISEHSRRIEPYRSGRRLQRGPLPAAVRVTSFVTICS
jgi:hypothetical protein